MMGIARYCALGDSQRHASACWGSIVCGRDDERLADSTRQGAPTALPPQDVRHGRRAAGQHARSSIRRPLLLLLTTYQSASWECPQYLTALATALAVAQPFPVCLSAWQQGSKLHSDYILSCPGCACGYRNKSDKSTQLLVAPSSVRMRMENVKIASQAVSPETDLYSGAGCGGQRRLPGHLEAAAGGCSPASV